MDPTPVDDASAHPDAQRAPSVRRTPATRRRGRLGRRVLPWVAGGLGVLLLVTGGTAYAAYRRLDGNIQTRNVTSLLGQSRPRDVVQKDLNILVAGSDSRAGLSASFGTGLTTQQSDTLLVLHVAADRRWATVVSFPRDSWVTIPRCTRGDGTVSTKQEGKINEAFSIGSSDGGGKAGGAACAIKTIERTTGLRIDHYVVVDFAGFAGMVKALGGVPVCLPTAVNDPKSHLNLPAGRSVVSGGQALAFVRARHNIGDGSDLGRIKRQQQFMASLATTAESKLYDAPAIYRFLDAATKSLSTDPELGSLTALYNLATSLRGIPRSDLTFVTVPNHPRADVVPSDTANVLWQRAEARALFESLIHDQEPVTTTSDSRATAAPSSGSTAGAGSTAPLQARTADEDVCAG